MKFLNKFNTFILTLLAINFKPDVILAADASAGPTSLDMIFSPVGIFCILIFILAYGFVMAEEFTHFRKSKPVILAATIIWVVIAYVASQDPSISPKWAETQFRHVVLEFAELSSKRTKSRDFLSFLDWIIFNLSFNLFFPSSI